MFSNFKKSIIVFIFFSIAQFSFAQDYVPSCHVLRPCNFAFISGTVGMDKTISFEVASLRPKDDYIPNYYSGLQGTMPIFGSKIFIMNALIGVKIFSKQIGGFTKIGVVPNIIAGLYSSRVDDLWRFNYGAGLTLFGPIFGKRINIGVHYTNNEKLVFKLGFYYATE